MWRAREVRDGLKEAKREEVLALSSEVSHFWPAVSSCAGLDPTRPWFSPEPNTTRKGVRQNPVPGVEGGSLLSVCRGKLNGPHCCQTGSLETLRVSHLISAEPLLRAVHSLKWGKHGRAFLSQISQAGKETQDSNSNLGSLGTAAKGGGRAGENLDLGFSFVCFCF